MRERGLDVGSRLLGKKVNNGIGGKCLDEISEGM